MAVADVLLRKNMADLENILTNHYRELLPKAVDQSIFGIAQTKIWSTGDRETVDQILCVVQ